MFRNVKSCSIPGLAYNEDSFIVGQSFLAVIDGATGLNRIHLTPSATDAQWLSCRVAEQLACRLTDLRQEILLSLQTTAEFIKAELDQMGYRELHNAYPSASISIVRIKNDLLECFVLGDCPIIIGLKKGVRLIRDDKVPQRDAAVLNWMSSISHEKNISMSEAKTLAEPILTKNRQEMNREDSYWIFDPTGVGIPHGITAQFALKDIENVALTSDGFFAYYDSYSLTDSIPSFLNSMKHMSLQFIMEQMRSVEGKDSDLRKFPRFKISDDATAVYAEISSMGDKE